MRTSTSLLCLALQTSLVVRLGGPVRPEHLRYERPLLVATHGSGMACVALDMTVLAHTASPAHNDLRLFQHSGNGPESEVPYTLTESGPEPFADTTVLPSHVMVHGNQLNFDLPMPARPFSEVRLRLGLQDFVATATAEGRDLRGEHRPLGTVGIFDASGLHLGHWESLLLGESSWPVLHVTLDMRTLDGLPRTDLSAKDIAGAEVPPSRLRQTRYVSTVSTTELAQRGGLSVALLRVPAHVPVERVAFRFAAGLTENFAREVTVSARADGTPVTDTEALDAGVVSHILLPSGDPRLYPIALNEDTLDATLGATLARPATVLVAVNNAGQRPLPIRAVTLAMRERKLCFFADREENYVLRYGDPALLPPSYDDAALRVPDFPLEAALGAETVNPRFQPRQDRRPILKRHPELFWLLVLFCAGSMGGTALHYVQHRRV